MITINLLPEELRKKEEPSPLTKIAQSLKGQGQLFKNLAITAIIALIFLHAALFFVGMRSSATFKNMTHKYNQLLPAKKEYEALKAELDVTAKKAQAIDTLMANRFSWARKLNDLSDSMTQGIWLTGITYEEKPSEMSVQVKASSSLNGGKKEIMKAETKKVNMRYLNISGYASSMGEQGTALIGKFIQAMKDNPAFFRDFSEIKLESIKSDKILDQEVMNFKISCLFKT